MARTSAALRPLRTLTAERRATAQTSDLLEGYATDPFLHLDHGHVNIIDLETLRPVELHPYEHQRAAVADWIDLDRLARTADLRGGFRNVHEEKSRKMGLTWILAWVSLWAVTYHPVRLLVVNKKLNDVDDGGSGSSLDSFFGRIRWMHGQLDIRWQAPLEFKYGQINHEYDSSRFVVGEGASPDPGRGGQFDAVLMDEAAAMPFGKPAHASVTIACPSGVFYNSTPRGEANQFATLRKNRPRNYRFRTDHWSQHPTYGAGQHIAALPARDENGQPQEQPRQPTPEAATVAASCSLCDGVKRGRVWRADRPEAHRYPGKITSPWYEEAILDLTDEEVASELDIDYAGSLSARVYTEFREETHVSPYSLSVASEVGIELAFDYGLDTSAVVILQDFPEEVRVIGEVEEYHNAIPDVVVPRLIETLRHLGVEDKLLTETWTRRMLAVGDIAGEARAQTNGRSVVAEYNRLGFRIQSRRSSISQTLISTKRLLVGRPKPLVVSGPDCPLFIEHMKNNRWPTDRAGNRKQGSTEPINDEHNHMMRAFAYWAFFKYPPKATDDSLERATDASARPELVEAIEAYHGGIKRGTRL